ncbi:CoA transferase [Streptomyces sp. HNM0575]|uniref:CaiB/BaiF CoA transferase family protein n=1 Tax=Streptomyces sp. HNM0575 TaxID=2716338 RepID=UPI00145D96F5|nr:CoA transferase [Streptomyces sp. HNM0575]NLU74017.1 CoA transferase [Streptomyces sp. HNM0575]
MSAASSATGPPATGPLAGHRVLDLTNVIMGPYATQILADQGADVIVVEPRSGDTNRLMGPGPHPQLSGISLNLMRNKRSVTLDLKSPAGRDAVRRLLTTCDAVVASYRPGALRRMSLDYARARELRPDVVYCQGQGFPLDSDRADEPAYDDIVQAASGLADAAARVSGTPALLPTILADKVCGLVMAQAVTAALLHRERTGTGQHVEVPMVEAMRSFVLVEHGAGAIAQPPVADAGYPRILSPHRRPQRTLDGWISVLPYAPGHYADLFAEAGRRDLANDPRYADRRAAIRHSDSLYRDVAEVMGTRTTGEWLGFCATAGIPASAVATLDEIVAELPTTDHPAAGSHRVIPPPARFSRTPSSVRRGAPLIGQDTDEVLAELERSGAC